MKKLRLVRVLGTVAVTLGLTLSAFAGTGYRVIANPSVKPTTLSKSAATAIFLKKTLKWEDGNNVVALDQIERSPVRASFSTSVLGKSAAAVKSYWNQQIFSGRDVPPAEKASDDEVLSYVRTTAGAVGYVSETADTKGVKVIDIR